MMVPQAQIGERVRRLRLALGLGQVELAQRASLPTGAVSMLENGRWPVDGELLATLARVLDCTPGYLVESTGEPLATRPWLRAYADAPRRTVDRMIADSVTAVEMSQNLGLKMLPDAMPVFEGDLNDDEAIEQSASETRAAAGLEPDDVVRNMIRAAERLGCIVLPMDDELGRHLGLSLRVDGSPVIRVSRSSENPDRRVPGDRQRFTVAHELGHLTLHNGTPPPDSASDAAWVERQAHRFAAAFLAPGDAILTDLEALGGRVTLSTLAKLKGTWGIAIKALVIRFQHLGVVDDDQARSLYKQISSRRWNKVEPVPVGNETAIWLGKALENRWRGSLDPIAAAAATSGIGRAYFARWTDWALAHSDSREAEVVRLGSPRRPTTLEENGADAVVTRLPVRHST